jgi:flagellar protein FliS
MSFSTNNAAQAYKQAGAAGALGQDPHGLIAMLFEGAMIAIAAARTQMQLGQVQEKCQSISKAISIIEDGLHASLDEESGGEISGQLAQLYEYMVSRLVEANTSNQADALDEVGGLLSQLASAWAEIKPTAQAEAPLEGV